MAWEDRTPAEKRQAEREAEEYAATDDDNVYDVITPMGTHLVAKGINSAKVLAGRTGSYQKRDEAAG